MLLKNDALENASGKSWLKGFLTFCSVGRFSLISHRKSGFNFRHIGYRRISLGTFFTQRFELIIFVTLETGQLTFISGRTWFHTTIFVQVCCYYFYIVQLFSFFILNAIFHLLLRSLHNTEKPLFLECVSTSKVFQQVLLH